MRRASKIEQARRLSTALDVVLVRGSARQALRQLVRFYGMSRRQAYRYIRQARQAEALGPPEGYG